MLFDIHTHHPSPDAIFSVLWGETIPDEGYFSFGVHPDFPPAGDYAALIREIGSDRRCLAIGECGLDKNSPMSLDEQLAVFRKHIEIAEELGKPLVIHCVAYYDEIIRERAVSGATSPWIMHGFRKNPQLAESLLNKGFYISLNGFSLHNEELIKSIPSDRLFFETDDDMEDTIKDIYKLGARQLEIPSDDLEESVDKNLKQVFGIV